MQLPMSDLLPQPDVDRPFLPMADLRETPTPTAQDPAHGPALQDDTAPDLDLSLRAHALRQDEDVEEVVEDAEQVQLEMVAGGEEAQVIAATAVMMIEAEAEVGDVEVVEGDKCTMK
ncbi:hypothetical protein ONS96_004578 [Cadophora gregata f. sp. sojae]|nr:hypothetical protein ONS96_004578 [Cadophora gregata f. sp. sojae]